jgi:hypothetical protein
VADTFSLAAIALSLSQILGRWHMSLIRAGDQTRQPKNKTLRNSRLLNIPIHARSSSFSDNDLRLHRGDCED